MLSLLHLDTDAAQYEFVLLASRDAQIPEFQQRDAGVRFKHSLTALNPAPFYMRFSGYRLRPEKST
jgi:hypothetical protein